MSINNTYNFGKIRIGNVLYALEVDVEGTLTDERVLAVAAQAKTTFATFAQKHLQQPPKDQTIHFNWEGHTVGQQKQASYQDREAESRTLQAFQRTIFGAPTPPQPKREASAAESPLHGRVEEVVSDDEEPAPVQPQAQPPAPLAVPVAVAAPVLLPVPAPVAAQAQPPVPAVASGGGGVAPRVENAAAANAPAPAPMPAAESPVHHRPIVLPRLPEDAPVPAADDWENRRWVYFRQIIAGNDLEGLIQQNPDNAAQLREIERNYTAYCDETRAANETAMRRCQLPFIGHIVRHIGFLSERRPILSLADKLHEEIGENENLQ